ncbi:MAG: alanine racemase, partial [Desulfobacterales bacterium]|nr:alanine racemase [Desulfobacterales bacterium]
TGKTIRVASKSIRCPDLIQRVFDRGGPVFKGILAYAVEEAAFLAQRGFKDLVVAYPTVQESDLNLAVASARGGCPITLMVDAMDQLERIQRFGAAADVVLPVCLDLDMSWRPLGSWPHLGVRRSPLRSPNHVLELALAVQGLSHVTICGLMGYEAQVASLNDRVPGRWAMNGVARWIKKQSDRELGKRRHRVVQALADQGLELDFVNGGGSGSLRRTGGHPGVTEVTAGSAFFAPGLFRYFQDVRFEPSAYFALQVARVPAPAMVTCQGGGYVGSGEVGENRLPWPVMPPGLTYLSMEGAGEVQTPLVVPRGGVAPAVGDPVFFQHAKAGELCEHFNELICLEKGEITGRVKTYRGLGRAFL